MEMFRDLNMKYDKLRNFRAECKNMYDLAGALIEKRKGLIEFNGFSDWDKNRLEAKYNPEDYYCFKLFDKGISIIYTNYRYNEEYKRSVRTNKYGYSIKYYGCLSECFKDSRMKLPYCDHDTSYGYFESLDVAVSHFRRAVVDLLVQFGNCKALSPMDFI